MNPCARWQKARPVQRAATRRRRRLQFDALEERALLSTTGFEPIDGIGNNLANPNWGSAGTDLLRLSAAAYPDGVSAPSLPQDPSARVVSDVLNNQADPSNPSQDLATIDQNSLSDFGYVWGQFIDHDMDLTPSNSGEFFNIAADPNDPSKMATQTFE